MKIIILGLLLVVLAVAVYAGCKTSRAGYETAPYKVARSDGAFELREYPTLTIVQTPMRDAHNGFMRLFRYIDGQNVATQKIAMTTPVFTTTQSMAFVLPEEMPSDQVPQPRDSEITVASIAAGTFAVMRFSGSRNAANEKNALAALTAWLQRATLTPTGEPMFGYFDPPWTPPFLRRNEVILRLTP